jgi:hypothetical protein
MRCEPPCVPVLITPRLRRGRAVATRFTAWLERPQRTLRLEILRIVGPLAILGFMSDRLAHAPEWLSDAGFRMDGSGDWHAPTSLRCVPPGTAWVLAGVMVASAIAVSAGYRTRPSALLFASTLFAVGLLDHLTSFTVTKIGPVLMLVVALSGAGRVLGADAWRAGARRRVSGFAGARSRSPGSPKRVRPLRGVRFLQLFLVVFYCASGIAKAEGDWLRQPLVMWSHLHDSYQTAVSLALASHLPGWVWTLLQGLVLAFEALAPLWFALRPTRNVALGFALAMHVGIALMFGPVVWFAILMIAVLLTAFLPDRLVVSLESVALGRA